MAEAKALTKRWVDEPWVAETLFVVAFAGIGGAFVSTIPDRTLPVWLVAACWVAAVGGVAVLTWVTYRKAKRHGLW